MGRMIVAWALPLLFLVFLYVKIINRSRAKLPYRPQAVGHIEGPGEYDFDIVGESFYQDNLAQICGEKTDEGHRLATRAVIIPYSTNPTDDNAVRVEIDGLTVGHLNKESARRYRKQLSAKGIDGAVFSCDALVVGGWNRGGDDSGSFGVKLDIPTK